MEEAVLNKAPEQMPDEERRRLLARLAKAAIVAPVVTVLTEAAPNPALAGD